MKFDVAPLPLLDASLGTKTTLGIQVTRTSGEIQPSTNLPSAFQSLMVADNNGGVCAGGCKPLFITWCSPGTKNCISTKC